MSWNEVGAAPKGTGGGGSSTFGTWMYGDGSDGPLKFTASPRTVSDASLTTGSSVITSATADFTEADVGLICDDWLTGENALMPGSIIQSVTNSTTVVINTVAENTITDDTIIIGNSTFAPGNYSSITIPTGATAVPITMGLSIKERALQGGAFRCSGEYYIDGTIDLSGSQTAVMAGPFFQPPQGVTGDGVNATPVTFPWGGTGGDGDGGTGGVSYPITPGGFIYRDPLTLLQVICQFNAWTPNVVAASAIQQGCGGSGAGDGGSNNGGNGGFGGLPWVVAAKSIVHGPNASYILTGGVGQDGAGGNSGGGGGGADGWWVTVSDSLTGAPSLVGGGGTGGAGTGTGTAGTTGQPGFGVHYTPAGIVTQTP